MQVLTEEYTKPVNLEGHSISKRWRLSHEVGVPQDDAEANGRYV